MGRPIGVRAESILRVEFENGSRILSLPGAPATIRGLTADAVILDESARIEEELYHAVRPMLATTGGKLLCLSTPHTRNGFFFDLWHSNEEWERVLVKADKCPRISPEFLAAERAALGEPVYKCEYECEWLSMDSPFEMETVRASINPSLKPLFGGTP